MFTDKQKNEEMIRNVQTIQTKICDDLEKMCVRYSKKNLFIVYISVKDMRQLFSTQYSFRF
jgi:hypothetical protein